MKIDKRFIISVLMLLPFMQAFPQTKLVVVQGTVDCGNVAFQQPAVAQFELRNRSGRSITIERVETSCGCTTIDYPHNTISGGQRFNITGTFDAKMLGHFVKTFGVYVSGYEKPVYLTMKGVVLSEIVDYSGSHPFKMGDVRIDKNNIEFDNVNRGDKPYAEIQIMNTGRKNYTPELMHLPSYLSAQAVPEEISPKHSGKLIVTLDSRKLRDYGLTQTSVYLSRFKGDKVGADNEISVSSVLLPDFKSMTSAQRAKSPVMILSSKSLDLGSFGNKSKMSGTIIITNTGKSVLDITSLQMFTSGLEVTVGKKTLNSGESTKMKITAIAKYLKNARSKPRVLMITNDPSNSKVIIDINIKE